MFLVVDTGKVSEVLLEDRGGKTTLNKDLPPCVSINSIHIFNQDLLFQVEHRDSVSDRTDHSVSIFGEAQVSLPVNCSEQVGKLQRRDSHPNFSQENGNLTSKYADFDQFTRSVNISVRKFANTLQSKVLIVRHDIYLSRYGKIYDTIFEWSLV